MCIPSRQTAPAVNCRQIKGDQVEGKPFEKYSKFLINLRERPFRHFFPASITIIAPGRNCYTYFHILKWNLYSFSSLSYFIPGPRYSARHFNEHFVFREPLRKVCLHICNHYNHQSLPKALLTFFFV